MVILNIKIFQLHDWYQAIPQLYEEKFCLINEHLVGGHLWWTCANYGPLSTHNCFSFESYYGQLVRLKSGSTPYQSRMLFTIGHHHAMKYLTTTNIVNNSTWQGQIMEKIGVPIRIIQNKYSFIEVFYNCIVEEVLKSVKSNIILC